MGVRGLIFCRWRSDRGCPSPRFDDKKNRADLSHVANFVVERADGSSGGSGDFDGRFVAHDFDNRLIEGDDVADRHFPAHDLGFDHAFGEIGKMKFNRHGLPLQGFSNGPENAVGVGHVFVFKGVWERGVESADSFDRGLETVEGVLIDG